MRRPGSAVGSMKTYSEPWLKQMTTGPVYYPDPPSFLRPITFVSWGQVLLFHVQVTGVLCPYLPRHNLCLYLGLLQGPYFGHTRESPGVLRYSSLKSSFFPQGLYFLTLTLSVTYLLSDTLRIICEIFSSTLYEKIHKVEEEENFWEKHTHEGGGERVYTHIAFGLCPSPSLMWVS